MNKYGEDVAVIKESLKNIEGTIKEIKGFIQDCDKRITVVEIKQEGTTSKLGILAAFQMGFSIISAAIAGYLGTNK
jgi:hypothetical protein